MATQVSEFLTPPQVAERLRVSREKVIGWILAGELKGCNLAAKSSSRPRYRVSEEDLTVFLDSRSAAVSVKPGRRPFQKTKRRFYQ